MILRLGQCKFSDAAWRIRMGDGRGPWPEFLPYGQWLSGMVGAPVILISLSLAVVLQIGLLGRAMDDAMREWWSRLAAFIAIYSVAALAVAPVPKWPVQMPGRKVISNWKVS